MRPVRFDDEAAEELAAAALWYDEQNPGIGTKLTQATREAARRLAELIFIELLNEIRVLAVAHYRRRPGYWRSRL